MGSVIDLLERLEKQVVFPGTVGQPPHVILDLATFRQVVDQLRAAERRRKVPRETKRAS